ncbi:MAG: hypothetical protein IPH62_10160 [Ignavibacteriae bacterium]|nr:hypothetical protein [Ignavibacteriota bacterium]
MQNYKNIVSVILITSMLISNIGFILHEDCCFENAKFVINVFNEESCCSVKIEKDNCCSENEENDLHKKFEENKNCSGHCYSINRYVKLDIYQINLEIEKCNQDLEVVCNILIEETKTENQNYFSSDQIKTLPNISGRSLVIALHKTKIPALLKA